MNKKRFDQVSDGALNDLKELMRDADVIGASLDATAEPRPKLQLQVYDVSSFMEIAGDQWGVENREEFQFPYELFFLSGDIKVICLLSKNQYQALPKKEEVQA
ncbi:hypothetical protein [Salibacterium qingdaonense]|uniref:Uncharacterized protein n=1 Tax=Salibacterium qingdaonense TaxID=266892 RepID=A0A1I4QXC4_9BACI|nr:hypothetical protein [Salibacterium qingdaonense]SFM44323.1 hypothetical protein SAMN04488054_15118 [Salibacterium qingdaonense]